MHAALAKLDAGEFIEGHYLDEATAARGPAKMICKRLSQRQAKLFLDGLEGKPGDKKETKLLSPAKKRAKSMRSRSSAG